MDLHTQPALVLGRSPQGDRAVVLRLWLRDVGIWSAYIPSVRSAAGGFRPAFTQPLSALEVVPVLGPARGSLGRIKEARLNPAWQRLHDEPPAQMLVMFASEVLRRVVHEGSAGPDFFDEVMEMLRTWDLPGASLARGPLDWTLLVCRHLGFALEAPEATTWLFYPSEGEWAPLGSFASPALRPEASAALADALHGLPQSRSDRNEALDAILAYLEAQHPGWGQLKSLEVLREL